MLRSSSSFRSVSRRRSPCLHRRAPLACARVVAYETRLAILYRDHLSSSASLAPPASHSLRTLAFLPRDALEHPIGIETANRDG